ncbi:MAG: murein biosynthesis integral membrane protein MurJ [Firmicutes bacterium]|nr:murein biosynthesis integral membrane protein MurJ [Bacillota bacterium]
MYKEGKSIFIIMIITLLSRSLGFIRQIILAYIHGTTGFTDAYLMSTMIPVVIFSSIGIALKIVFIPLYTSISKKSEEKGMKFTNNIINSVFLITIIMTLNGLIFTEKIVNIFAKGFNEEILKLTIEFTRILFPGVIIIGINFILMGFLNANKNFSIPTFVKIPNNIIIIISLFFSIYDFKILIYGSLLGSFIQMVILLYFSYKKGYRYKFVLNFKDEIMHKMIYLVTPVFIGTSVNQLNVIIDRSLASSLTRGSISALNFAEKLNSFVFAVFAASLITVIYPKLSEVSLKENEKEFKECIINSINILFILLIPITIGAMVLSMPIVKFLFQRGEFDISSTVMTSEALFYYSIGIVGFGLRNFLSKVFYSLKDTKTPLINGVLTVFINVGLNFLLIKSMAHKGLALATSLSTIVGVLLLSLSLKRKVGSLNEKKIFKKFFMVILASIPMGVFIMYVNNIFIIDGFNLILTIFLGAFIYLVTIIIMGFKEINILFSFAKRYIKNKSL